MVQDNESGVDGIGSQLGKPLAIDYRPDTVISPASHNQAPLVLTLNQSLPLDGLGPVIVNVNGTLSRITNWLDMSEQEQASIMRIIPQRNQRRMKVLKEQLDIPEEN
ncbi:hypothetical protein BASA50_002363 [Batrachochytrium salamandrivorans]|uniref:Uncharacterized protein n=1 Tax=Batrachochytrium salamandrivorans TaxID=1357716 RepID=A0ABQ8FM01_9FUNG|nr:hypothetical protein BASA50_002363 [Batrachochytrium salamandrivorans]KAH9254541.1 hypothetical protein BASA81_007483 [Batrachochytrium salamandrivorans]KAH9268843.1 hypothetical protein BASA83_009131 [Batrachochytrium salamandrivorans]KAJ1343538.1 hypothetical protein BSLG_001919 [Batrachochytrium salamandrivorans]KAJ1345019.1 hypothetical protein BSLG_000534 [Batrachochytrium salamandrivorans]